ncbi:GNAT family N-acetyltransferase [Salimicrobium jeotgali]|uniref:GNAT family N-acetyltransferase n=1 Tax=Salimicrobium jeotgali TaxID=1230341 RepID=K2GCG1_9BACI|nr:GNAT family N-acetyltransferase [Salimicrobium jeotgali]AKG04468.1 GNAT family N-acetyltransferase [Salimicrobium jeotgali]EKE32673.1 N-acetyltransferase GCN5 [Salimicrobium jeotgali]MBM7695341.1 RimJ/RimL family protein N-acetyltransferase [Salimicrobium jeotgali]
MITKEQEFYSETERLVLRPLESWDYERWLEGFRGTLPQQYKHDNPKMDVDGWTQEKFNDVVSRHKQLAEQDEGYILSVFRKSDLSHIGMVGLWTLMRREFQWGFLEYRLHNHYWKNGYGKESVSEGLNFAFKNLDFHRMEAHINLDNKPSVQLAERVGLTYECTRKKFINESEGWTDNHIYYMNSK